MHLVLFFKGYTLLIRFLLENYENELVVKLVVQTVAQIIAYVLTTNIFVII